MSRSPFRVRLRWLVAAGLVSGLLTACAQPLVVGPAGGGAAPEFEVAVDKPGDRVLVTADVDGTIFDVWSETGIGGASVSLTAGALPQALLLRLHLRGLEQMTFAYNDTVVSLSVPSGGDRPVLQSVTVDGDETQVTAKSSYWMDVTRVESAAGGYFQVSAPQAFHEASTTTFKISWIDFFR